MTSPAPKKTYKKIGVLRNGGHRARFPVATEPFTPQRWQEVLSPSPSAEEKAKIEADLLESKLFKEYRADEEFAEVRGWAPNISNWIRLGEDPNLQPIIPYVFQKEDLTELALFIYPSLLSCGAPGLTHGGWTATYLDDVSYTLIQNVRDLDENEKAQVTLVLTAYLNVAYKKPVYARQWLCVHAKNRGAKGRKWYIDGAVKDLEGNVLITSEALFLEVPSGYIKPLEAKL